MILRLDKLISSQLNISRNDVKAMVKKGQITVNSQPAKSPAQKCDTDSDVVMCNKTRVTYSEFVYIMLNKPKGVISATDGKGDKTVIDILPSNMKRRGLFPAGRLDKDTTGFCLITDDGAFAHSILSPSNHVEKEYIALLDKPFDENVVKGFERGVILGDDDCLEASLTAVNGDFTCGDVVIRRGMYHQVKRMFKSFGLTVVELHRVRIGGLVLDENLVPGECRYLTNDEKLLIKSKNVGQMFKKRDL